MEPMPWTVARRRQNSGERDEEFGDPDAVGRSRRVVGSPAHVRCHPTLTFLFFSFFVCVYALPKRIF